MEIPKIYHTASEEETRSLGESLGRYLKAGDTVSLEGDLGTGKTAMAKGIALGLGISDDLVSPTFTLVNTYEGPLTLHHFDVYRVDDPEELYAIGWEEYVDGQAVCLVEWGDRIPELLPSNTLHIKLERNGAEEDGRIIVIERQAVSSC